MNKHPPPACWKRARVLFSDVDFPNVYFSLNLSNSYIVIFYLLLLLVWKSQTWSDWDWPIFIRRAALHWPTLHCSVGRDCVGGQARLKCLYQSNEIKLTCNQSNLRGQFSWYSWYYKQTSQHHKPQIYMYICEPWKCGSIPTILDFEPEESLIKMGFLASKEVAALSLPSQVANCSLGLYSLLSN